MFLDIDNVLQRMTIIGMILRFRQLTQEALHDVLIDRIPYLLSSILDFHDHAPNGESMVVLKIYTYIKFCILECSNEFTNLYHVKVLI